MRRAIFPGTFDPYTLGHHSIVMRALTFVDEVIIGIGLNEDKKCMFSLRQRMEYIRKVYADEPRVKVVSYIGLTVDFAKAQAAQVILRGIRSVKDFEYEEGIADINRKLTGIETVFLFTEPELAAVSSSVVRELLRYKRDVRAFLPEELTIES